MQREREASRRTRICVDAGPLENSHRSRGIGMVARSVLQAITPELADRLGASVTCLSRRPVLGTGAAIRSAQRSYTAEWTGVNGRLPEVVADYVKALESTVVLPRDVRRTGADVVLSFDPRAVPLSSNFRTVAFLYDLIPLRFPEQYLPRRAVVGRAAYAYDLRRLKRADRIIAISEATRKDAVEILGIEPGRIRVAHLAADESRFHPRDPEAARLRSAEAFGLDRPYVLYVGGFDHRKNVSALLSAAAKLEDQGPLLAIAGPMKGPGARLKRDAELGGLGDRVRWLGYVPDDELPDLYAGALGLVFPSLYEGFGLTVLEAMSCGTPVLTSPISSLPEIAGGTALYVDPHSPADIASGLQRLISDESLRTRLRRDGIERARRFSWMRTAERVLETCVEASLGL